MEKLKFEFDGGAPAMPARAARSSAWSARAIWKC